MPSFAVLSRAIQRQMFWILLLVVICFLVFLPIGTLIRLALENNAAGLRAIIGASQTPIVLWNTVLLGVGALVVAMVSGTVVAFAVWSLPDSVRRYTSFIPVLPLLIPSVAHVIGFVFLFSPENGYINTFLRMLPFFEGTFSGPFDIYTIGGIVTYTGLSLSSFVYLFVLTGLQELGTEYVQAARVNGAGPVRTLFSITLPSLRPVFVYAGMVVLLLSLGQFTAPLILGRRQGIDVITTQLYLVTTEVPVNYAVGAAYAAPLLVAAFVILWMQRRLIGNRDRFIGRGHFVTSATPSSKGMQALAVLVIVLFALISAILPLAALVFVAFTPFWSGTLNFANMTLRNFEYVLGNPIVVDSIFTTVNLALISIAILIPLGMLVAMAIFFRSLLYPPLAALMDAVSSLPLAIPSALVGFGFLFAYIATPFGLYGTSLGLVLAFVAVKLPFAVRYQLTSLIALGSTQVEAARVNGSSGLRTFLQIILPLARGGVVAAAAVIFVLLVHEFGVALMLRTPNTNVMSVVLFELYHAGGLYPHVAAMAVLMTLVTIVGVIVALWFGGTKAFQS